MEYRTAIETFFNWYDAAVWLEGQIKYLPEGMKIETAEIKYINNAWRAAFSCSDNQMELPLDD